MKLAAVMVDGGRMRTRTTPGPSGVHDPHWRETKAAVLLRMTDTATGEDHHPELPQCFASPMKSSEKSVAQRPERAATVAKKALDKPVEPTPRWSPEPVLRTGLASLANSETFGWILAADAERRGFFSATKGAFVADGQSYNWAMARRHFPKFTPILDFMHAAEHLYEVASALGDTSLGRHWAEACWKGEVAEVIKQLRTKLDAMEPPSDRDKEPDHLWYILGQTIGYLETNQERMDYPRYRRDGLPITSSPVESWIKQLNQRVKGSDQFWEDGRRGEAILQVRAAWQSEDESLENHLQNRTGHCYAQPIKPKTMAA
ncbi:MAG: hypothetical protein ACKO85_10170 [Isosphaeraceae bacterium]